MHLFPRDSIHSRDALFIYAPEEKSLFAGDGDCEDYYENNGRIDPEKLFSLAEFFQGLDFKYYLFGHDMPDTKENAMSYLQNCAENF